MFNNISKKISKMSTENIQNYQFRIKLLMFLLTIIYIIGTFFLLSKDMMFVFWLLTIAMVTFIFFYPFIAAAITKGVYMILTDALFPEPYLKALDEISSYKYQGR
ncbi:hypothetical protein SAMN05216460_0022 [Streptococcus sp. 45]|nr:hypothetical protein SAMN05216460_0022 [Streptococcus sp. 45]